MNHVHEQNTTIEDFRTDENEREVEPIRYSISSYGADYTVDGLVKRVREGSVYIPEFQRGFVWSIKDASRFIESLLLGLPIPGIFLAKETDTGKLLVVDGQQRLLSLRHFYDRLWEPTKHEFSLDGVDPNFNGRTYDTLRDEDRRRLDDAILHTTVFRQEQPSDGESSVYQVFERLNSGGRKLRSHEIRNAIHHTGRMRVLLQELNSNPAWRGVYGHEDPNMRDQELVLRALAIYYEIEAYEPPLVFFLNHFMGKHKQMSDAFADEMRGVFTKTIEAIHRVLGSSAFRPKGTLNAAVFDSVMVGVARRIKQGPVVDFARLKEAYERLLADEEYLAACGRGTASKDRVGARIRLATKAFSGLT